MKRLQRRAPRAAGRSSGSAAAPPILGRARARRARPHAESDGPRTLGASDVGEWYKDAIIYELHVRSFQDANSDGIGDFPGLTQRLPYLHDLGVTAIWLLPFYPSPLRDDGYDIADYLGVHEDYGTIDDFRRFVDAAHGLGLRIITELVINHTSDQHPWFLRARHAPPESIERNFYVWSQSDERYSGARVIFSDAERSNWAWDPVAGAYYWHRFYSHQPDLNYENPAVFDAIREVLDHWFRLGVDGMRLDAVPYLVEREGTHSENLDATHAVIKRLRAHVDQAFGNRVFIAEANQWPEDAVAYFGSGDESHLVFHFPLMPRLFMGLREEDRLPIVDILAQTPAAPTGCQWALFLRNHDELTLEMVSEEERLYMYEVYASDTAARLNLGIRRRLAPLLGNDRRRMELMNALLFSLPGTPVLYYGDEIGMGDNIYLGDRNGVRTPMQWSGERNAGFSDANPQRLFLPLVVDDEYHHQSVHVSQQRANPHSLLSWMKRLIAARKRYQAFGRGELLMVDSPNRTVLAFLRRWRTEQLLIIANLSRFVQHATLDLSVVKGTQPVGVFGRTALPVVTDEPYHVTLGPHGFFWLELTPGDGQARPVIMPHITVQTSWDELFTGRGRADLESSLPAYVQRCTAWNSGSRTVLHVAVEDAIRAGKGQRLRWLLVLLVAFSSGEPERYLLPLGIRRAPARRSRRRPDTVAELALASAPDRTYELFDAAEDPALARWLLEHTTPGARLPGAAGSMDVVVWDHDAIQRAIGGEPTAFTRARRGSNALVGIGHHLVLKLFRQIETGKNPELEMRAHLEALGFRQTPRILAAWRWESGPGPGRVSACAGVVQEFVENQGEAWSHAVTAAGQYLERASKARGEPPPVRLLIPGNTDGNAAIDRLIGPYGRTVHRLAECVAELHRVLASPTTDAAFAPEHFSPFSRRSEYQRMRRSAVMLLDVLRGRAPALEPDLEALATTVLERGRDLVDALRGMLTSRSMGLRIRCHGNLHLGQVLYAGDELVLIDFDGEPGRPLYERRLKRSPLRDVATVVRSFHYAAHAALTRVEAQGGSSPDRTRDWMRAWQQRTAALFVEAYAGALGVPELLPASMAETYRLLGLYVLERAVYESRFELDRGSPWLRGPLTDLPLLVPPRASAVSDIPPGGESPEGQADAVRSKGGR